MDGILINAAGINSDEPRGFVDPPHERIEHGIAASQIDVAYSTHTGTELPLWEWRASELEHASRASLLLGTTSPLISWDLWRRALWKGALEEASRARDRRVRMYWMDHHGQNCPLFFFTDAMKMHHCHCLYVPVC
jgi:hypothetical protein